VQVKVCEDYATEASAQKKLDQVIREAHDTRTSKGGKNMHHIKAIITKHGGKTKPSKGFSPSELKEAGLTMQDAKQIGIPMDIKRKSRHDENVATLKAHAPERKPKAAKAAA
jgi:ribosomal protein L13E